MSSRQLRIAASWCDRAILKRSVVLDPKAATPTLHLLTLLEFAPTRAHKSPHRAGFVLRREYRDEGVEWIVESRERRRKAPDCCTHRMMLRSSSPRRRSLCTSSNAEPSHHFCVRSISCTLKVQQLPSNARPRHTWRRGPSSLFPSPRLSQPGMNQVLSSLRRRKWCW